MNPRGDGADRPRLPPGVPLTARLRLRWIELLRGRLSPDKVLGFVGEDAAARFLRRAGFRVMARNVVTPQGEADLVARAPDAQTYVVVEVKTRRARPGGQPSDYPPELSVHAEKRRKLGAIARHLSKLNRWGTCPVRIDVVAIEWPDEGGKPATIRHWVDAVR